MVTNVMPSKYPKAGLDKSDQRYFPRWEVKNRVIYELWPFSESLEAQTLDLSCAGTCLVTQEELSQNQKIKLKVYFSETLSVDLSGTIVWTRKVDGQLQVGINFFNTTEKAQELILKHAFSLDKKRFIQHIFDGWGQT